jgi:hypothetical protein
VCFEREEQAVTTYELTILGGTVCGIAMVVGGILLLYKGSIKLEVASKDPALTVEVFEKQFKLTTHAPALGLFVIGLLFVGLAIYFGRETAATPIELKGTTGVIDEPVTVFVRSEWGIPAVQGSVHHVLRPQLDVLWIYISAPGYEPYSQSFPRGQLKKSVDFGEIKLRRKAERIEAKRGNIVALPPGITPPPFTAVGGFGGGGVQ